jgi:hypothetical protein
MKYICMGYLDESRWGAVPEAERRAIMDECIAYDQELQASGAFIGGEALQSARTATTVRWKDGKVAITDGPFAETKEQLGGIIILEATDLDHAIRIMSKHPGVRLGEGFEIRPTTEVSDLMAP